MRQRRYGPLPRSCSLRRYALLEQFCVRPVLLIGLSYNFTLPFTKPFQSLRVILGFSAHLMTHSYFSHHVFFCLNQREAGQACCNPVGKNVALFEYAKQKISALEKNGPGKIRINKAGCLSRCEQGPVIVIYPEAIWYTYIDQEDIDEIINSHLLSGKIVERLRIE